MLSASFKSCGQPPVPLVVKSCTGRKKVAHEQDDDRPPFLLCGVRVCMVRTRAQKTEVGAAPQAAGCFAAQRLSAPS